MTNNRRERKVFSGRRTSDKVKNWLSAGGAALIPFVLWLSAERIEITFDFSSHETECEDNNGK